MLAACCTAATGSTAATDSIMVVAGHKSIGTTRTSVECLFAIAGAVILPPGKGYPGTTSSSSSSSSSKAGAPDSKAVCFATAGEKGVVKVWSAATGQCLYEQASQGGSQAGNFVDLALLPAAAGLMAASADCNIHFFDPKVGAQSSCKASQAWCETAL